MFRTFFIRKNSLILFFLFFAASILIQIFLFNPDNPAGQFIVGDIPLDKGVLDLTFNYSDREASDILEAYGPKGRNAYIRNLFTIDVIYPFLSACSFAFLFGYFLRMRQAKNTAFSFLLLLPVALFFADICENICLAYSALTFPGSFNIVPLANLFTMSKWILIYTHYALIIVLIGATILNKILNKRKLLEEA